MAAHNLEVHHQVPRCLLRLHDRAVSGELDGAGIEAWLEFEHEAMRYGVDVEISREDLAELVEASTVLLARNEHRNGHESDWERWGRRGGLETARRYGSSWFALLALRRWGASRRRTSTPRGYCDEVRARPGRRYPRSAGTSPAAMRYGYPG